MLEEARQGKLIGASLEARVLLHVADSQLSQQLASLDRSTNGADPLRYIFITSQVGRQRPASPLTSERMVTSCKEFGPAVSMHRSRCAAEPRFCHARVVLAAPHLSQKTLLLSATWFNGQWGWLHQTKSGSPLSFCR